MSAKTKKRKRKTALSHDTTARRLTWRFSMYVFVILILNIALFSSMEFLFDSSKLLTSLRPGRFLTLVVCAVASLTVGGFFSYLFLQFPMKPVQKLLSGMRRLAGGHFEERLHLGRSALLREMSDTFNTLAAELQNTEIMRTDFVNNFSHEFKTPIVSIRGFARMLQKGNLTPSQQQEYLAVIAAESDRLCNMATNVLNLTRIENQQILAKSNEFNLSEQLRRCILIFEKKWSEKRLEVEADFPEYVITGDEELLNQVWYNLLDNGIRFAPEASVLTVSVKTVPGGIGVSFTNRGPMIRPQEKKRLFDKFWQGDPSRSSEGAGIGLSIVQKIVHLHKGAIDVDSTPERTVFTVTLPVSV